MDESQEQRELAALDECLRGNKAAFEVLVHLHEKKIYNFCQYLSGNSEDAEDLAQEVFIKAFYNLSGFRRESSFYTWLHRIAVNTWISWQRKHRNTSTVPLEKQGVDGSYAMDLPDPAADPLDQAQAAELREFFNKALDSLNTEYRAVLVLREIEGFSYEEIAASTSVSVGTVKSRLNRARQILKDKIREFSRA
ncbi:MAG: sigma-70 family RNA polymerase sigma factor [Peptococcaceae bacterium]|jgi:RNA polymerase sigma-70 factor (ECF subfamily)|nr:sigma-70 family RNA polymerase sigma factor [Peptococcaceae bacterium]